MTTTSKQYDRAYFDKWYRDRRTRVSSAAELRRKVSLALASAEYFLRRPVQSVLDVGCGEGAWRTPLRKARPNATYLGYDASPYVVQRFGRQRNIRLATFADLPSMRLRPADLVVCSDVLHYIDDDDVAPGIKAIAAATRSIAYIEVLTAEDEIEGDLNGLKRRPAAWYRRIFERAGLTAAGPYLWLAPQFREYAAELEILK